MSFVNLLGVIQNSSEECGPTPLNNVSSGARPIGWPASTGRTWDDSRQRPLGTTLRKPTREDFLWTDAIAVLPNPRPGTFENSVNPWVRVSAMAFMATGYPVSLNPTPIFPLERGCPSLELFAFWYFPPALP